MARKRRQAPQPGLPAPPRPEGGAEALRTPRETIVSVVTDSHGLRCGWFVGVWFFASYHASTSTTVSAVSKAGKWDTGHRLPAWLRPGTKWPPGKKGYLCLTWSSADLEEATSFPATVSTLWFRQHGPACQRARVPIRAASARVAGACRPARFACLSTCGWACPPGSRADFTPRATGSPASYSALSQALLTVRGRFLSGRRSEAARARHYGRRELSLPWPDCTREGARPPPAIRRAAACGATGARLW